MRVKSAYMSHSVTMRPSDQQQHCVWCLLQSWLNADLSQLTALVSAKRLCGEFCKQFLGSVLKNKGSQSALSDKQIEETNPVN